MAKKTQETGFKLPAATDNPRGVRPRFKRKLRGESSLQHPNQSPTIPPSQNQSSEDAASSGVEPKGKGQRRFRGLSAKRTTVTRRPFLRHLSQETQSGQDQGSEDPASPEVGPAGKGKRPPGELSPASATVAGRPFPRYLSRRQAALKDQDQSSEDAASLEVGPAGKGKRPSRRLGRKVTGTPRLAVRNAEAEPDSCNPASEPNQEKLHLGAMAALSLGSREIPSHSLDVGNRSTSSGSRRGLFWHLRAKHSRVGLFEIGPGHELHRMTRMMQEGLWAATQVSMNNPPTGFELGTLAGPAFARLRQSIGLTEEDYQATLGPGDPYLQFLSTSKSKASFFLSHDQRFFVKTQRRQEVQVLLAHLPRYVRHLQQYPHSLLARLLGVYSLRVAQGKKKYFIIMQCIFYPTSRISERYDIKGCEVSRWVDPVPEGSPLLLVLKDLNFREKTIKLGTQRSWFLRQMALDTAFLRELNVLDYSLLVGVQFLHKDEKVDYHCLIGTIKSVQGAPKSENKDGQNRRMLPNLPNALHIVDGPDQRYFLGLVDLTTVYGFRKRLEHLWKMVRYPGQSVSTVSPAHYARRLCQWAEAHTE
ncbi:phosphatidylinositol 4-phosphate 5-kinase-like protein 1 isoform X2 [Rattus norvegicus]|uniref:Phosphatidylinositol-4-phosphate 5-kinase-like 1 n=1 Tax=Rattus norvegicus TaxID=10116 RepID=A0A8I6AHS9_RAT|nr:phosphatidylinositol 4-phosphate 5-kinase-like protein 1 isoform X2 [Rattus norvegicus]